MTADEKLDRMAEISMLASKLVNLILTDPLDMPDCAFACGIALNGILEAHRKREFALPPNAELDLIAGFVTGLSAKTAVMFRKK